MNQWQIGLLVFVLLTRLVELWIAKRNTRWAKQRGGYEVGKKHYPLLVWLHICFFLGIWLEATSPPEWWVIPFAGFVLAQGMRIWVIQSLGRFWNTRIWIVPGRMPKVAGPYRYIRHPNYLVVIIEILTLPIIYQAYLTAILISFLNAYLLWKIRIPIEEKAWQQVTNYHKIMADKHRLLPHWKSLLK